MKRLSRTAGGGEVACCGQGWSPRSRKTGSALNGRVASLVCLMAALLAVAPDARATSVNFDGISTASEVTGPVLDSFLATYGVSVVGGSGANSVAIINNANFYGGGALDPSPYTNFLMQESSDSGQSFTLEFSNPVASVSFTRPELLAGPNGIIAAAWIETAYNSADVALGSNAESAIASYSDVPAQTYTLSAADIASVTFWSDGYGYAGIEGVPMTDLRFTSLVPEPPSLPLLVLGLAAMAAWSLRRRTR